MRAELRTAQTRRLAKQCTCDNHIVKLDFDILFEFALVLTLANQQLGCIAAGGEGSDMTAAAGLTFCLQLVVYNGYSGIADAI